uniref:Uncharacterized protein n=1 Tax=Candidatus Kentrum sp. DK TaxID=2126562 RepID=A0A450SBI0_9GAMM|nr:MAG: hypothetical protein BECKDK2373B_GA0170837_102516 [Candidatus Kentron sp. DK]
MFAQDLAHKIILSLMVWAVSVFAILAGFSVPVLVYFGQQGGMGGCSGEGGIDWG